MRSAIDPHAFRFVISTVVMQHAAFQDDLLRPRGRVGWTLLGLLFFSIAVIGVYLPGVPTTGPLLLGSFLLGKGNPAMRERLLSHRLFAGHRGYLDGSKAFTPALRCWALLCMWASIAVSCLLMGATPQVGRFGVPASCLGGVIGTVVILLFRRRTRTRVAGGESRHGSSAEHHIRIASR
jgi:uncharacterized membrane protein YbaN (DUF454 family)